jgi:hypothetical protein
MSIQTIAALTALGALWVIQTVPESQQAARKSGAVVAADFDYEGSVSACSLTLEGDQSVLAATIALPPQRKVIRGGMIQKGRESRMRASTMANVEFAVVPSAGGGNPAVTAMAIDTKGIGASDGRLLPPERAINQAGVRRTSNASAAPGCETRPSPRLTLTGTMRVPTPLATCAISDDGATASIRVPLSSFRAATKPYRGHVTLMKRGEDTATSSTADGGSTPAVLAACTSGGRNTGYDLAVAKGAWVRQER